MIDELVLEKLLDELGQDVVVPPDGAERVVLQLATANRTTHRPSPRLGRALMVAAVIAVVAGIGLLMKGSTKHQPRVAIAGGATATTTPPLNEKRRASRSLEGRISAPAGTPPAAHAPADQQRVLGETGPTNATGPVDAAKIVKTGTLDLQVPKDSLRPTVNRVTGVVVGLRGYVAESRTDYTSDAATAQITVRVPVDAFETAISRVNQLPGVKVLGDSENGSDVTAQYTNLQAQLNAATVERDSLLQVLADANNVGDILAVHDRIAAVNSQIDQLQGQINLLNDQASYSSIAITITEKHVVKPAAAVTPAKPPTGIAKAWDDARQGFSNSIEWLIARSGGALIVLLAVLALVFGIRYLYPVIRRALL